MTTPLSQCDSRWGNKKLGTSNKTICSHGCLITVVSIMAGTTPDIINQSLINAKGYKDDNLLIWNKLAQATNGILDFQYLHYTYDNDKVKEIIKREGSCIVMVKHPSGFNHFVLYIGGGKMLDPLTGRKENTNKYPSVIKFADVKINNSNTNMTNWGKIEDELEDVTKLSVKLGEERDRLNKEIESKDSLIRELKINSEKKYELLQNEMDTTLAQKNLKCQDKIKDTTIRLLKDFELKEEIYKKTISDLEKKVEKGVEVVVKPPPKPKKLREKISAILDIIFET